MTATAARPEGDPQIVVADVHKFPRARPPFVLRNGRLAEAADCIAFLQPQHVIQSESGSLARSVLWFTAPWCKVPVDFALALARYCVVEASEVTAGAQDD